MTSSSLCNNQLCGFLSIILPIFAGIIGLLALYVLVRYWEPITRLFRQLFFHKSPHNNNLNSNMSVNAVEAGGTLGEPQTFQPNFFFLRQNSLNDGPSAAAANKNTAAVEGTDSAAATESASADDSKRRLSKSHPACSPTFQTDPIDWADLGIKLPGRTPTAKN